MGLIIPKCNADYETLLLTLKVYYDKGNWLSNAELIETLSRLLIAKGIEPYKKEPQSYTKKTQVLSYYGLLEWMDPEKNQSDRRISDRGRLFYEYLVNDDKYARQSLLIDTLNVITFGRNVLGCNSDSDLEAPNIFLKSALILGYMTNLEFAYILGEMEYKKVEFADALVKVSLMRKLNQDVVPAEDAAKWADAKPIIALADWGIFETSRENGNKVYRLDDDLIKHFKEKIITLRIKNVEEQHIHLDDIHDDKSECTGNKYSQIIYYGCPGTGKSHTVEMILKSASKAVVKVAETAENRSLNFHQYLKEQPYFQTGDAYHFAIKSRGKKSLYNVIIERGLAGDIDSCFDITDLATLRKIYQSIKDNNPFLPQHQEPVYALEYYIKFLEEKPKVQFDTEFRTTFHPDSDYASFVGCYKPTMIEGENDENRISYAFVPQVFTNAYVRAWELYNSGSKENVYLVIEEINRGNCAQIFGDLFQLLDRYEDGEKAGFSKYKVDPDADLSQYLVGIFDKHDCAKKLCLPPNLNILATMNTSDQSLFPIDSAFKRRWSWKYVPIDYEHEDSSKFTITIGDRSYSWNKFLQDVNERIKTITQSEDKQIGNFFIAHADIKQDEFINKVMFYLWSEICKDNYKTRDNFFRNRNNKDEEFSFNDLFGKGAIALLQGFMAYIAGEDAVVEEEAQEVQEVNG